MIYQVSWHEDASDHTEPRLLHPTVANTELGALILQWTDKEMVVDYYRRNVVLGRARHSDLVLDEKTVSRSHAAITIRRGQVYLTDKGINGTYVRNRVGTRIHVLRSDFILDGDGELSLGRSFAEVGASDVIRYRRDRRSMFRV